MTQIRLAAAADLPVLAHLHAQSFPKVWDEQALADLLGSPGTIGMIAGRDGFILIRTVADEAEILTICVSPDARRRGVGAVLLQAAALKASEAGAAAMFLEVVADNEPAQALYGRHGFRAVGARKAYYQGKDALVLKADLPLALAMGKADKNL